MASYSKHQHIVKKLEQERLKNGMADHADSTDADLKFVSGLDVSGLKQAQLEYG